MSALILQWLDERRTTRGSVPLDGADVELGRELIAQLGSSPDASVSRRPARIFTKDAGFAIEHLGSRNGTRIGGAPATALAIPLADAHEPLGALVIAADDARPLSDDDALASRVGAAPSARLRP